MKCALLLLLSLFTYSLSAQSVPEISQGRKNVRTSGDLLVTAIPAACLITTLALQDWEGLQQGALSGLMTVGVGYGLKKLIDKERPDKSNDDSFPSLHTAVAFVGAAFIQKRYGWKWGIPSYAVATYVGWSRVYGKKHDWVDVASGAALGIGSAYIFTSSFSRKHHLSITPIASNHQIGLHASMIF